jgi:hypothetical protein
MATLLNAELAVPKWMFPLDEILTEVYATPENTKENGRFIETVWSS